MEKHVILNIHNQYFTAIDISNINAEFNVKLMRTSNRSCSYLIFGSINNVKHFLEVKLNESNTNEIITKNGYELDIHNLKSIPAIVLEGCDCSGKTTLAKSIKQIYELIGYELDIAHCTSKDPKDYLFYSQTLRKTNIIYDRHFVGEMIYPEVYNRPKSELSEVEYNTILKQAETNDNLIIFLCPPDEVLFDRLNRERPNEPECVKQNIFKINIGFTKLGQKASELYKNCKLIQLQDGNMTYESLLKILFER